MLGRFATGVTVVTTKHAQGLHGMTANAFSSVSLNPPLVLVCVDHRARMHTYLPQAGVFAVNILSESQADLSDRFAGRGPQPADLFEGIRYRTGFTGCPIFEDAIAYLDCVLEASYEGGDHTIFLGRVEEAGLLKDEPPLLFFASRYRRIAP